MSHQDNTLFLRLEGPLQAWGDPSKFVVRRTMDAPTKSGVIGLICAAMGLSRTDTSEEPIGRLALRALAQELIPERDSHGNRNRRSLLALLSNLRMGVRIDAPGVRWWDYHTVGAKVGLLTAEGILKRTGGSKGPIETLVTRREYLCDASFLVALEGDPRLIQEVADALASPKWPLYLGRKACPPAVPVLVTRRGPDGVREPHTGRFDSLKAALSSLPWQPRYASPRERRGTTRMRGCLLDWQPASKDDAAPPDAEVWYDVPVSFDPPFHQARFVMPDSVTVTVGDPLQWHTPPPTRPRTDYDDATWGPVRDERLEKDHQLCVFCKGPLTKRTKTVQHVTYRHAGREDNRAAIRDEKLMEERLRDLRSLCRLCHDAVTMIEYGLGMGLDRINPEDPRWRDRIIQKRDEIIAFRSLETRRRKPAAEEVE